MGKRWKPGSFFDLRILSEDDAEAPPEDAGGGYGQRGEEQLSREREVLRLGQGWEKKQS